MSRGVYFGIGALSALIEDMTEVGGADACHVDLEALLDSLGPYYDRSVPLEIIEAKNAAAANEPVSASEVLISASDLEGQPGGSNEEARTVVSLSFLRDDIARVAASPAPNPIGQRDGRMYLHQLIRKEKLKAAIAAEPDSVPLLRSELLQMEEISIFAGYVRDQPELAQLTGQVDVPLVLVAPTNDGISKKLDGLKPSEFPHDIEQDAANAERNLKHFVESHVVQGKPGIDWTDWAPFFMQGTNRSEWRMDTVNGKVVSFIWLGGKLSVYEYRVTDPEAAARLWYYPSIFQSGVRIGNEHVPSVTMDCFEVVEHSILDLVPLENGFIMVVDDPLVHPAAEGT